LVILLWCWVEMLGSKRFTVFICSLFDDAFSVIRLYSIEWKDNRWMINWKGFGRKWSWPNFKVLLHTATMVTLCLCFHGYAWLIWLTLLLRATMLMAVGGFYSYEVRDHKFWLLLVFRVLNVIEGSRITHATLKPVRKRSGYRRSEYWGIDLLCLESY
jgi:hypothetical protein